MKHLPLPAVLLSLALLAFSCSSSNKTCPVCSSDGDAESACETEPDWETDAEEDSPDLDPDSETEEGETEESEPETEIYFCPPGHLGASWVDPATGLRWQLFKPHDQTLIWQEAMDYCDTLEWEGLDNWRLPTINELRSIIRGCTTTELSPESPCLASDECTEMSEDFSCLPDACFDPCPRYQGPTAGCYWDNAFCQECYWWGDQYWSSTLNDYEDVGRPWGAYFVNFNNGTVGNWYIDESYVNAARCVRGPKASDGND